MSDHDELDRLWNQNAGRLALDLLNSGAPLAGIAASAEAEMKRREKVRMQPITITKSPPEPEGERLRVEHARLMTVASAARIYLADPTQLGARDWLESSLAALAAPLPPPSQPEALAAKP